MLKLALLSALGASLIVACSEPREVENTQLVMKNDIVYEMSASEPFTGTSLAHYTNGRVASSTQYKDGLMHGLHAEYSQDGLILTKCNYAQGQREGRCDHFDQNGNFVEAYFVNNVPDGRWIARQDQRVVYSEEYKDGLWNGLNVYYYNNGQVKSECNYQDDKEEGLCKYYYTNGKLQAEINMHQGQRSGTALYYNEEGVKFALENYVQGKLHGLSKILYKSGALKSEISFKQGIRDGKTINYSEDGEIENIEYYKDGKLAVESEL